jgi:hypothetical protein
MPKSTTIVLAEQEYTVTELPSRKNAEWRVQVDVALGDVSSLLGQGVRLTNLQEAVDGARALLLGGAGTILGLIFDYAPEVEADRERIEAEVYDSEVVAAFLEVATLAYPFGSLLRLGMTGPAKPPTSRK